jgi:hypothetical protein
MAAATFRSLLKTSSPAGFPGVAGGGSNHFTGNSAARTPRLLKQDLWLRPEEIVTGPHNSFYTKLAAPLAKVRFTATVHLICGPHYRLEGGAGGRPPVDPAVLMRMLIVGFLEGIGSERGIASRCADSLAVRRFLGYSLTEETPDHSIFTVFRRRLPVDVFEALHA